MYKINERLVTVCRKFAFQVHLHKHGVATVTDGAEPNLAESLLKNMQMIFLDLGKNACHEFRGFHAAGGGLDGEDFLLATVGL